MSNARAVEVSASSNTGFDDAINRGIHLACASMRDLRHLRSACVNDQEILLESGRPASYRVSMQVTFMPDNEG